MDTSCAVSAGLFFLGNLLNIILRGIAFSQMSEENYENLLNLDPTYLQQTWMLRAENIGLKTAAGMVNALAWFMLCVPILQVAWILSKGGKRHMGTHIFLAGLVIAGSVIESICRLMIIGVDSVSHWMATEFNLSSWNYRNDGIGWRVLEMVYEACNGIIVWIDAFEWLALSAILIIIYASADSERKEGEDAGSFSTTWAHYAVVIGTLCWFDFLADILRLENWKVFMSVAIFISSLNMLILFPVWLLMLGKQLSMAKPVSHYDVAFNEDSFSVGNERSDRVEMHEVIRGGTTTTSIHDDDSDEHERFSIS